MVVISGSRWVAKGGYRKLTGTGDSGEWDKGGQQEGRWGRCPPKYSLKLARWDSPRTQICILGCWIATGRRASHTETPVCPQTAEYSHQSQSSVRWGPRDLNGNTGMDEGRRRASHPCINSLRMVSVQPWSGSLWAAYRLAVPEGLVVTRDRRHKKVQSESACPEHRVLPFC